MHQPPTIPEGDEENEGIEQTGEGTRFPQTGAHAQPPPIHDTVATASDLQAREDEGPGYEQTPTLQNEMIAVSEDSPTEAAQQAQYDQPSSVEHTIIEDGANEGEPPATDAENEIQEQLEEGAPFPGTAEEETAANESIVEGEGEKQDEPSAPADGESTEAPVPAPASPHAEPIAEEPQQEEVAAVSDTVIEMII